LKKTILQQKNLIKFKFLDKVIFVPTGDRYGKKELVDVKHRFNREYNQKISHRCYIQKMEEKEENIVKKINQVNLSLSQTIKKNLKYLSKANGKVFEIDVNLPKLNFEKVVK
jgi:hypothetical protein